MDASKTDVREEIRVSIEFTDPIVLAPLLLRAPEEISVELDTLLIVIDASGPKVDRIEVLDAPIVELGSIPRLVPSDEA